MATIQEATEFVKQWVILHGSTTGPILPAKEFSEGLDNRYSVKSTQSDGLLAFIHRTFTINAGEVSDTAENRNGRGGRVIFRRCNDNTDPIKYGEVIAFGLGGSPTWFCHQERLFGVNLAYHDDPCCEWMILGGPIDTPVQTGERVALFNQKFGDTGDFLIREETPAGFADLATATDRGFLSDLGDFIKDNIEVVLETFGL